MDADDMRSGWLLQKIFGHKYVVPDADEDEESAPALGRGGPINGDARPSANHNINSKWGARGISVSADTGVLAGERERQNGFADQEEGIIIGDEEEGGEDAKMRDPDELARILDDDEDDEGVLPGASAVVGNGSEWREGGSK